MFWRWFEACLWQAAKITALKAGASTPGANFTSPVTVSNSVASLNSVKEELGTLKIQAIHLHKQHKRLQTAASQVAFDPSAEKVGELRKLLLEMISEPPIHLDL